MIKIKFPFLFNIILKPFGNYAAMSFFIFIIYKNDLSNRTIRHEYIHFFQQLELLFVFHWILYILNTLYNLIKYRNYQLAYRNNVFEKEAYDNEKNVNYLLKRKLFAWTKYI